MFNLSLSIGTFLSKWKESFLIPIFKTGERNDVGKYRGVYMIIYFFFQSNLLLCLLNMGFFKGSDQLDRVYSLCI
jgi:hypothetical protein